MGKHCKEDPNRSPQRAQRSCERAQMSTLYEVWGQYQIKDLPDIHKLQEFQHSKVAPASSVSRKFPARSPRLKGSAGLDCEVSTPFWVKALVLEPYRRSLSGPFGVLGRRDRPCSLGRNTWAGHRLRWAAGSTDSLPYLIIKGYWYEDFSQYYLSPSSQGQESYDTAVVVRNRLEG